MSLREDSKRKQEEEEEEESKKSCCCMIVVLLLVVFIVGAFSYPTIMEKFNPKEKEVIAFESQTVRTRLLD